MRFAVRRGDVKNRLDAYSNQSQFQDLFDELKAGHFTPVQMRDVALDIFSGTTPLSGGDAYTTQDEGVPFIRSGEVNGEYVDGTNAEVFLKPEIHDGLMKRSQLQKDDLLIAIVGATIGAVSIYVSNNPANINQAIAAVRLDKSRVSSEFVRSYISTPTGQRVLDYLKRPVARANVNLGEVGDILMPLPPLPVQNALVSELQSARTSRRDKLAQADALLSGLDAWLLDRLGLQPPKVEKRAAFAVTLRQAKSRLDADFHSPDFRHLEATVRSIHHERLGKLAHFSTEVWQPENAKKETFHYIEISGVNPATGVATAQEIPVAEAPSRARMLVRDGDLIISTTRPHHGSIAQIDAELDDCIASTGFAVVRQVDEMRVNIAYLWCMLRSQLCLRQMLFRSSGGNYPAIGQSELEQVIIPLPPLAEQELIADEVRSRREKARQLRSEAQAEWDAAKARFEAQILGGEAQ